MAQPAQPKKVEALSGLFFVLYMALSCRGMGHVAALFAGESDAPALDGDATYLLLLYVLDYALASVWGVVLFWDWTIEHVTDHHWPTILAIACSRVAGISLGERAPWLFATGLAIQYNESSWNLLQLYRPPWAQRSHVFLRATMYPLLIMADIVTYWSIHQAELAKWSAGAGAGAGNDKQEVNVPALCITQFMLPMMYQHANNFYAALRLVDKLRRGKFKVKS